MPELPSETPKKTVVNQRDQETYNQLIETAKQCTDEGHLKDALDLYREALKIYNSEKLAKKIVKIEVMMWITLVWNNYWAIPFKSLLWGKKEFLILDISHLHLVSLSNVKHYQCVSHIKVSVCCLTPNEQFLYARIETGRIMWLGMTGGRPHRFPHNNFSSVYQIFTKLGHMISLWKGKSPIYFGVIRSKVKVTIIINRIFDNRVVSTW